MPATMTRKRLSIRKATVGPKGAQKAGARSAPARKTLRSQVEIDAWFEANSELIVAACRANMKELTGREQL